MVAANSTPSCLRCGKNSLLTDDVTGEQFCSKCGYVVSEKSQESGPEWRSFQKDGGADPARTGAPSSLMIHDMGLSTVINPLNKDASGKPLSTTMKSTIERLRTWDSRSQVHEPVDRNLRQALSDLNKLKDKVSVPANVLEKAAYIYRKAIDKKLVKGRSIQGLVAACVYAACRDTETPRTLDNVADGINIRRKDVARCYRLVYRELDLKVPVADPINGIPRIASIAGLGEKTKRKAVEILRKAKKIGVVAGKDPTGLAAAALYLACITEGGNKTQKEISEASGVTEVTIRNRCAGLKVFLEK